MVKKRNDDGAATVFSINWSLCIDHDQHLLFSCHVLCFCSCLSILHVRGVNEFYIWFPVFYIHSSFLCMV